MDIIASKICNAFTELVIHCIEYGINDTVVFSYQWESTEGTKRTNKRRSKIRYNAQGRAYFIGCGCRQYLDEFIKNT